MTKRRPGVDAGNALFFYQTLKRASSIHVTSLLYYFHYPLQTDEQKENHALIVEETNLRYAVNSKPQS